MPKHEITFDATIIINGEEVKSNLSISGLDNYAHLLHLVITLKEVTKNLESSLSQMPVKKYIDKDELYEIAAKTKLPSKL